MSVTSSYAASEAVKLKAWVQSRSFKWVHQGVAWCWVVYIDISRVQPKLFTYLRGITGSMEDIRGCNRTEDVGNNGGRDANLQDLPQPQVRVNCWLVAQQPCGTMKTVMQRWEVAMWRYTCLEFRKGRRMSRRSLWCAKKKVRNEDQSERPSMDLKTKLTHLCMCRASGVFPKELTSPESRDRHSSRR